MSSVIIENFKKFASVSYQTHDCFNAFRVFGQCLNKSVQSVIDDFINLKSVDGAGDNICSFIVAMEMHIMEKGKGIIKLEDEICK